MIDRLDEEYIDVLVPILTSDERMKAEEAVNFINNAVTKQNYNALAHKLQLIFAKDVVEHSTKEKIAMSEKMSERMHKLRDINNRKVVNFVLMKEDHEIYPKALEELMVECADIIKKEKILKRLNGANQDMKLSEELTEKYQDMPYLGFAQYIARTTKADFEWTKTMLEKAKQQAINDEMEEALQIVKGEKAEKKVKGQEKRERRVKIYTKLFQEQIKAMQEKGYTCEEKDFEKMKEFQRRCVLKSYPSESQGLCFEFATKYLANLSDTEFMNLLRNTGKVKDEQYKSLTRKYKEIDLKNEYMTHGQWDKISAEQSMVANRSVSQVSIG